MPGPLVIFSNPKPSQENRLLKAVQLLNTVLRQLGTVTQSLEHVETARNLVREVGLEMAHRKERLPKRTSRSIQRNPKGRGEMIGSDVLAIVYVHADDGQRYCHGFADADITLRDTAKGIVIEGLAESTGVEIFAMPDGTMQVKSADGKRLWDDFDQEK